MRDHERDSSNRHQSAVSLWRHPTHDEVLSGVHQYKEVCASDIPHKHTERTVLPTTFFQPVFRMSSFDYKDLPGQGAPSWNTMRAADIRCLGANTDFLEWTYNAGKMDDAAAAWKGCLATRGTWMRRSTGRKEAFFSLGHVGPMVYFWAAEPVTIGAKQLWKLAPGGAEQIFGEPILQFDDWEVRPG